MRHELATAIVTATALTVPVVLIRAGTRSGIFAGFVHALWFAWEGGASVIAAFLSLVVVGTGASRTGIARKARLGVAQEAGGRRSARHVVANAGAAAIVLILGAARPEWSVWTIPAAAAALAGSLADTVAGEWGMLARETPRLLLFGPMVIRGTDGGMTWAGVFFSLVGGAITATAVAATDGVFRWAIVVGGLAGSLVDSLIGATLERRGVLNNEGVNFASSSCAAAVGAWLTVAGGAA